MQTDIFKAHTQEKMKKYFAECKVDFQKKLDYPPTAISLGSMTLNSGNEKNVVPIPIGTYGNFSMIVAPPKTKKSFFVSILVSAYLAGRNDYCGDIRGHREDRSILHLDTEQGKWHCQRVFKRADDMAHVEHSDKYHTFGLRTMGYKDRIEFIEYCLKEKYKDVGLIALDGVADLVSDVNDIEQSNDCVQKLMEWSANYDCHIVTVIHSNFGSNKATGHLGSCLMKKTETEIHLETNDMNNSHINVTCKRSRGYSFSPFAFKVNNYGFPKVIETYEDHNA